MPSRTVETEVVWRAIGGVCDPLPLPPLPLPVPLPLLMMSEQNDASSVSDVSITPSLYEDARWVERPPERGKVWPTRLSLVHVVEITVVELSESQVTTATFREEEVETVQFGFAPVAQEKTGEESEPLQQRARI